MTPDRPSTEAGMEVGVYSPLWIASVILNAVLIPVVLYVFLRVIPHFIPFFTSLGAKLPSVTIVSVEASCFLQDNWLWFLPLYLGTLIAAFRLSIGRRGWIQVLTLVNAILLLVLVVFVPLALVYPVLELHRQLG